MSASQNLSYAAIQVVHNLGAVAIVGGSVVALTLPNHAARKRLAQLVLFGWVTQGTSGLSFGLVSYYYDHELPDISGIASYALGIKMVCATLGILLLTAYLWRSNHWTQQRQNETWILACIIAISAISAAAFLRWFA
jgi:NADH:ubiquinone oxidoreductase subunit 6 (subunit J)